MEFYTYEQYQESAQALREKLCGFQPKVLLILGSGLGGLAKWKTPSPSPTRRFPI